MKPIHIHEFEFRPTLNPEKNVAVCNCGLEIFVNNIAIPGKGKEPYNYLWSDSYILQMARFLDKSNDHPLR